MSIEQTLLPLLTASLAPAPVYNLFAPQLTDDQPNKVPYTILSRIGSTWSDLDQFCKVNDDLPQVLIQIDCYALTLLSARQMAEKVRGVLASLPDGASPDSEFDLFEDGTRVFRVTSTYTLYDSSPAIV